MTPLARSLARLRPDEDWVQAECGPRPDGWIGALDAAAITLLRDSAVRQAGAVDSRTLGATMMLAIAGVTRVAALLYARERRVPDLSPTNVAYLPGDEDEPPRVRLASSSFHCLADDPDAGDETAVVVGPEHLRRVWVETVERFVTPTIAPLRTASRMGAKGLWGLAASSAVVAVASEGEPDAGRAEAQALLAVSTGLRRSPPRFAVLDAPAGPVLATRLGACCRAYLWATCDEKCSTCPLVPEAERWELARAAAAA